MAGLTPTGLEILRLPDVIAARQELAQDIFSDQVAPGDTVDVSGNSTIGRMIGVVAPAEASLWEALQQIIDSFNPATATGYALDNIVALSGITRLPAAATSAQVLLTGTVNTLITSAAKVSASNTQRIFSILSPVALTPEACSGVQIGVLLVEDSATYRFSYAVDNFTFVDVEITSGVGQTAAEILLDLKAQIDASVGGTFTTSIVEDRLAINRTDPFQQVYVTTSDNLQVLKVSKLGAAVSDTIGTLGQAAGTINTIAVPVPGWDSVTNPLAASTGRFEETDEELRERWRNSKFVQAANIIEALTDALKNVEGVTDVIVYENDTDTTDVLGIPAHSFMPIVLGGLTTSVAKAIWENKPTGILSYGDVTVNVTDSQGVGHNISYRIPTEVPMYVSLEITDTGGMPGDVVAQLKQAIVAHGTETYFIGDDVIYSRLYTPVNSIPGFAVNSLTIGTSPSPVGMSNILIDFDEVAKFSVDNVVVSIV